MCYSLNSSIKLDRRSDTKENRPFYLSTISTCVPPQHNAIVKPSEWNSEYFRGIIANSIWIGPSKLLFGPQDLQCFGLGSCGVLETPDNATDKMQCSSCLFERSEHARRFLSPASAAQEYDHSLWGHTSFQMKCAVSEFNHSVIQNTITVHTWAYVIILQETNGNNTEPSAKPLWCYCSVSGAENQVVFLYSKIKYQYFFQCKRTEQQVSQQLRLNRCALVHISHAFN